MFIQENVIKHFFENTKNTLKLTTSSSAKNSRNLSSTGHRMLVVRVVDDGQKKEIGVVDRGKEEHPSVARFFGRRPVGRPSEGAPHPLQVDAFDVRFHFNCHACSWKLILKMFCEYRFNSLKMFYE